MSGKHVSAGAKPGLEKLWSACNYHKVRYFSAGHVEDLNRLTPRRRLLPSLPFDFGQLFSMRFRNNQDVTDE
jgi:hypothetical protein